MSELKPGGILCLFVWKSEKINGVLDSLITSLSGWNWLVDKYVDYPEGNMQMRMRVIEKPGI
jgi:hypothetical protein